MHTRKVLIFLSLIAVVLHAAYADYATQEDWSDKSGVFGPVLEWGNDFYSSSGIDPSVQLILLFVTEEYTVDDEFDGASSVYSVDIDDDGDMDILGTADVDDDVTWWENTDGSGTSWIEHVIDNNYNGARSVCSEDIDGDGRMDIISAAEYSHEITWWENSDTGSGIYWTEHTVDPDYLRPEVVLSVDLNGDGDMDVLSCSCDTLNHITWWENSNGQGTSWTEHTIYQGSYLGVSSVYSQDIDGDGDMDVVGSEVWDMYAGYIRWFENLNGTGTSWYMHTVYSMAGNSPWSVHSEDMDNDGDMDILASLGLFDGVIDMAWWENINGSGTSWTQHIVAETYNGAKDIYAEDMDNDGDMDITGAAYYRGFAWFENLNGSGTAWVEHSVDADKVGSQSVYAEDINGDGKMDVIGARGYYDNSVRWWNQTEYSAEGSLESSILDTDCTPQWASIDWNGSEPSGTRLFLQYRTSDNPGNMGNWSDPVYYPRLLSGLLDRYFQYRIIMESDNPQITPLLNDITLNWDPYGIEGNPEILDYQFVGAVPNPANGSVYIRFGVPELSNVLLSVFDLSGRLMEEFDGNQYTPGLHDVKLEELIPGIYFCRMTAGDFSSTQRFVVIR